MFQKTRLFFFSAILPNLAPEPRVYNHAVNRASYFSWSNPGNTYNNSYAVESVSSIFLVQWNYRSMNTFYHLSSTDTRLEIWERMKHWS